MGSRSGTRKEVTGETGSGKDGGKEGEEVKEEPPPKVKVKQFAWDGWEAWIEDCPLIRAKGSTELEAEENVLKRLAEAREKGI